MQRSQQPDRTPPGGEGGNPAAQGGGGGEKDDRGERKRDIRMHTSPSPSPLPPSDPLSQREGLWSGFILSPLSPLFSTPCSGLLSPSTTPSNLTNAPPPMSPIPQIFSATSPRPRFTPPLPSPPHPTRPIPEIEESTLLLNPVRLSREEEIAKKRVALATPPPTPPADTTTSLPPPPLPKGGIDLESGEILSVVQAEVSRHQTLIKVSLSSQPLTLTLNP